MSAPADVRDIPTKREHIATDYKDIPLRVLLPILEILQQTEST